MTPGETVLINGPSGFAPNTSSASQHDGAQYSRPCCEIAPLEAYRDALPLNWDETVAVFGSSARIVPTPPPDGGFKAKYRVPSPPITGPSVPTGKSGANEYWNRTE